MINEVSNIPEPEQSIVIEPFHKKFTSNENQIYIKQQNKCKFTNPKDEYIWALTQYKICSKCTKNTQLIYFNGNTSGTDAFDKNGYRLRRPECKECSQKMYKGKLLARKKAKEMNISYKAPEGVVCAICNNPPTARNGLVFDHCHKTQIFRGFCCNTCNRTLGVFGDDVSGILRAVNYLLKHDKQTIIQNENGFLEIIKKPNV